MKTRETIIVVVVAIAAFAAGFITANMVWFSGMPYMQFGDRNFYQPVAEYESNGEKIFLTGVNEKGERIPFVRNKLGFKCTEEDAQAVTVWTGREEFTR